MHVRLQCAWLVERSDAHEPEIGPVSVVAPDRGLTLGAAVNVVRSVLARHWHGYRLAAKQFDRLSLDDRVEDEGAARQPLAVVTMTAVDEHWLVEELIADGSAGTAARHFLWHDEMIRASRTVSLEVRADVFPHLVMPVGPFVATLRAPVVQMMGDPPVPENLGHSVGRAAVLPRTAAGREVNVAGRVLMQIPGIVLVGHIVDRIIEIEVVVVHPVHGIVQVVNAGERIAAFHVVWMFEEGVGGMIGAERCAVSGDRDAGRLALGVDEGKHFAGDVIVVLRLQPAAMERMRAFVVERIALDSVDAEDADSTLIDVGDEGANHALTFLLPLVAHAGRKSEDGRTVIAVSGDAHVPIEAVRIPTMMVTTHIVRR
jgi:hypothetical protein